MLTGRRSDMTSALSQKIRAAKAKKRGIWGGAEAEQVAKRACLFRGAAVNDSRGPTTLLSKGGSK